MTQHFKNVDLNSSMPYLDDATRRDIEDSMYKADLLLSSLENLRSAGRTVAQLFKKVSFSVASFRNA